MNVHREQCRFAGGFLDRTILNAEGLRAPERLLLSKRGRRISAREKLFTCDKITTLVSAPFCKGMIRHRGQEYSGEHPALIRPKLWQQANDDAVKELSFEEECELVRLIVRGVRVNRLDPEKEPIPGGLSPAERKIRTHWYSIVLAIFANRSLPVKCDNLKLTSNSDQNGAGERE